MVSRMLKAVFGNFSLKAIALLISIGIWLYATQQVQDEMLVRAGVEVRPPHGYSLLYQSVRDVQISLAGPRSLISRLRDELAQTPLQLARTVSEEELEDGWADLEIDERWVQVGLTEREHAQLRVSGIRPQRVRAFASEKMNTVLPVEFAGSVHTAPGFTHEEPVCVPAQATVAGPAAALEDMQRVPTVEVALYDIRSDVQRSVALDAQRQITLSNGEQIAVSLTTIPAAVAVHVHVSGEPEGRRVFPNVPVLWQMPPGFPYTPEYATGEGEVSVTVTGPTGTLNRLGPQDVRAFVDLARLADEEIEPGGTPVPAQEPVRVHLPPGFEELTARAEPANVTLRLKNPVP